MTNNKSSWIGTIQAKDINRFSKILAGLNKLVQLRRDLNREMWSF